MTINLSLEINNYILSTFILLDYNREAAEGAAARRGPKDKRRSSAPSEGQNFTIKSEKKQKSGHSRVLPMPASSLSFRVSQTPKKLKREARFERVQIVIKFWKSPKRSFRRVNIQVIN